MKQKVVRYGTVVVVTHVVVAALHGLAHVKLPVLTTPLQNVFIVPVIVLAPLIAMVLLWTHFSRLGALLLLSSMAGALAFGVYNHFVVVGPDHVSQLPPGEWGMIFQVTAILLGVTEGLGCWVGLWALSTRHPASTIH